MTFGSLFSGIGGMDLGLERAGMECKWQVEIDPFCQKVLEKHWPHVKRYGDITQLDGRELESVDAIAGGFPCQDISLEGGRSGISEGTRSGLWADMFRIVRLVRPEIVLVENVAALLSPIRGVSPILRVLGDLASIGFDAEWSTVSACSMGATHVRRRVFIVANSNSFRLEGWREKWSRQRTEALPAAPIRRHPTAPRVCSGIDGISDWLDRIRVAGNAVYPAVSEYIGRRILQAHQESA